MAAVGLRTAVRRAAAMLPSPASGSAVVTMLRMAARTAGALPVRTLRRCDRALAADWLRNAAAYHYALRATEASLDVWRCARVGPRPITPMVRHGK